MDLCCSEDTKLYGVLTNAGWFGFVRHEPV